MIRLQLNRYYRDAYLELIKNRHRRAFHWIIRFIPHLLLPYQRRAAYGMILDYDRGGWFLFLLIPNSINRICLIDIYGQCLTTEALDKNLHFILSISLCEY